MPMFVILNKLYNLLSLYLLFILGISIIQYRPISSNYINSARWSISISVSVSVDQMYLN